MAIVTTPIICRSIHSGLLSRADMDKMNRHPVTNEYLPTQFREDTFLKPVGDMTGKIWDESALQKWEQEENRGRSWPGRNISPTNVLPS